LNTDRDLLFLFSRITFKQFRFTIAVKICMPKFQSLEISVDLKTLVSYIYHMPYRMFSLREGIIRNIPLFNMNNIIMHITNIDVQLRSMNCVVRE